MVRRSKTQVVVLYVLLCLVLQFFVGCRDFSGRHNAATEGCLSFQKLNFNVVATDDSPVTVKVQFRNTGDTIAESFRIETSCSCTSVDETVNTVGPGNSAEFPLIVSLAGRKPGRFNSSFLISWTDSTKRFISGSISVQFSPPAYAVPRRISLHATDHVSAKKFRVISYGSNRPVLSCRCEDSAIEIAEIVEPLRYTGAWSFTVKLKLTDDALGRMAVIDSAVECTIGSGENLEKVTIPVRIDARSSPGYGSAH